MNVIPAKVAGVKEIVMVTPPDKKGKVNSNILVAAKKIIEHEVDSIPVVEYEKENSNKIKVIGRLSKTNITKLFLELLDN